MFAACGIQFAHDQTKQRGLAGTVGTTDRNPLGPHTANDSGQTNGDPRRSSRHPRRQQAHGCQANLVLRQIDRQRRQDLDLGAGFLERSLRSPIMAVGETAFAGAAVFGALLLRIQQDGSWLPEAR